MRNYIDLPREATVEEGLAVRRLAFEMSQDPEMNPEARQVLLCLNDLERARICGMPAEDVSAARSRAHAALDRIMMHRE